LSAHGLGTSPPPAPRRGAGTKHAEFTLTAHRQLLDTPLGRSCHRVGMPGFIRGQHVSPLPDCSARPPPCRRVVNKQHAQRGRPIGTRSLPSGHVAVCFVRAPVRQSKNNSDTAAPGLPLPFCQTKPGHAKMTPRINTTNGWRLAVRETTHIALRCASRGFFAKRGSWMEL
jgi:hypothetical protein